MLKTFRTFSLIKIFRERVRTAAHTLPAGPEVSPHPLQPCQENKEYRTALLVWVILKAWLQQRFFNNNSFCAAPRTLGPALQG